MNASEVVQKLLENANDDGVLSFEFGGNQIRLSPCANARGGNSYVQYQRRRPDNTSTSTHYEIRISAEHRLGIHIHVEDGTQQDVRDRLRKVLTERCGNDSNFSPVGSGFKWHQSVDCQIGEFAAIKNELVGYMQSLYQIVEPMIRQVCGDAGLIQPVEETKNIGGKNMKEKIKALLTNVGQVILHGAPGTGKTYTAMQIAAELTGDDLESEKQEHIKKVQFHAGYDYSDFVLGLKPKLVGSDGQQTVSFEWKAGVFKEFVDKAKVARDAAMASASTIPKFVFVIDEINRADLSRVFGELFSLIEMDYRYPRNKIGVALPNGENLVIPDNLYIIGTMNDIDRSVESMDFALRRRFAWQEIDAESSEVILDAKIKDAVVREKLKKAMRAVNGIIGDQEKSRLGHDYQIGGAIFANFISCADDAAPYDSLWDVYLKTIVNEYLRGNRNRDDIIREIRGAYDKALQET